MAVSTRTLTHLFGLLDLAKEQQLRDVCLHVITDGRDTAPTAGKLSVEKIQNYIADRGIGRIANSEWSLLQHGS